LTEDTAINNAILDNLSVRVSSLEYKVDRIETQNCDIKEDIAEFKDGLKEVSTEMKNIKKKVFTNGKTKVSDWVQIVLLVAVTILGIYFGV